MKIGKSTYAIGAGVVFFATVVLVLRPDRMLDPAYSVDGMLDLDRIASAEGDGPIPAADVLPDHVAYVCSLGPGAEPGQIAEYPALGDSGVGRVAEDEGLILYLDAGREYLGRDVLPGDGDGLRWSEGGVDEAAPCLTVGAAAFARNGAALALVPS